jgi:TetR/AcrR family transcriptional regulator
MARTAAPPVRTKRRPGPAGRAGDDPQSSRQLIFAAAAREFAAHSFAGASVDRIAASARLNKAMIYYHFGSKAGLYGEILRDMFAAVGSRVRAVAATAAPVEDKIRQFVEAIAIEAEARPHFPPIWFREIADGGTHLDRDTLHEVAGIVKTLVSFVRAGVQLGVFKPIDPFLVHGGIVGPMLLFFASGPLRERMQKSGLTDLQGFDRHTIVEHVQGVTLAVLRGDTARPGRRVSRTGGGKRDRGQR